MSNKLMDYLESMFGVNRLVPGEIRFSVNLSEPEEISFRIDALRASVEWGDGTETLEMKIEPFQHEYKKAGIYQVCVHGENITDIDVPRSHLCLLDVTKCSTLEFIDCSDNQIPELDLRFCKGLYEVYCAKNRIRELKLSKYRKLFYLSCSCNELEQIDVSGCAKLVTFRCRKNHLRKLDLSRCGRLVSLNVEQNNFDASSIRALLSTLVKRPVYDKGFLVLQRNAEDDSYDRSELQNYIKKRGWCEI